MKISIMIIIIIIKCKILLRNVSLEWATAGKAVRRDRASLDVSYVSSDW